MLRLKNDKITEKNYLPKLEMSVLFYFYYIPVEFRIVDPGRVRPGSTCPALGWMDVRVFRCLVSLFFRSASLPFIYPSIMVCVIHE